MRDLLLQPPEGCCPPAGQGALTPNHEETCVRSHLRSNYESFVFARAVTFYASFLDPVKYLRPTTENGFLSSYFGFCFTLF